jgi:hypothetical protein
MQSVLQSGPDRKGGDSITCNWDIEDKNPENLRALTNNSLILARKEHLPLA